MAPWKRPWPCRSATRPAPPAPGPQGWLAGTLRRLSQIQYAGCNPPSHPAYFRTGYGAGAGTQTPQTWGMMPVVTPPVLFWNEPRQPVKVPPSTGAPVLEVLITGREDP